MPVEPRVSDEEFVLYWKRAAEQGLGVAWVAERCKIKPNSARCRAGRLRNSDLPELPRMGPQGGRRGGPRNVKVLRDILKGEIE